MNFKYICKVQDCKFNTESIVFMFHHFEYKHKLIESKRIKVVPSEKVLLFNKFIDLNLLKENCFIEGTSEWSKLLDLKKVLKVL